MEAAHGDKSVHKGGLRFFFCYNFDGLIKVVNCRVNSINHAITPHTENTIQ